AVGSIVIWYANWVVAGLAPGRCGRVTVFFFFFSSRRRHTRSVSAFLLNRSSDLIINGVERPVKAAELFAFTLRVRAGNTDVLTDAEENVRQKLRAEGVM